MVLRCWMPDDAPNLKAAIDSSLEHLRRWMPWALDEPSELGQLTDRLTAFRAAFLSGDDFVYGIFDPAETEVLGGSGLHPRIGPGGLEIGYWIRADLLQRGLATEAARALTLAGLAIPGVGRIEIRCDPQNVASAAIPRRLGYRHRETHRSDATTPTGEPRDTMVFELKAETA